MPVSPPVPMGTTKMYQLLLVLSATRPVFCAQELAPQAALLAVPSTTALGPIPVPPVILCAMAALAVEIRCAPPVQPLSIPSKGRTPVYPLAQTMPPTTT